MNHHPALAAAGELEIAQRSALADAVAIARPYLGVNAGGADLLVSAIVLSYLAGMRRAWHPEAIEIGEGDYVVLDVAGARLEVHADVVRESDVQQRPGLNPGREWPTATLKGDGQVFDFEGEHHDVDGLRVFLGDWP